jgi:hypothetical protein
MDTHSTQRALGLPLVDYDWAILKRPTTAAGRYIQHRYRVCSELADLIAFIAGFHVTINDPDALGQEPEQ